MGTPPIRRRAAECGSASSATHEASATSPGWPISSRIKGSQQHLPPLLRGLRRHTLDLLRELGQPATTLELARTFERHGLDAKAVAGVNNAINSHLRRQKGKVVDQVGETRPATWKSMG